MNHLRPLIVIDGPHLKGPYLGTMFLAVGMDGNNQIWLLHMGLAGQRVGNLDMVFI